MHVKGLELPAYLLVTNPGYPWAIAGGHMSMATYMLLALEGDTSVDYWTKAITERGLYFVRDSDEIEIIPAIEGGSAHPLPTGDLDLQLGTKQQRVVLVNRGPPEQRLDLKPDETVV